MLADVLAKAIPLGVALRCYHLSTPPFASTALFAAAPGVSEQRTFCESHFLAVANTPKAPDSRDLFTFAIEVLIFTTDNLTTVFVSKADSTGYSPDDSSIPIRSLNKSLATAFIQYLVNARLHGPRVVVSLFARSQNQYLFPGSVESRCKRVLDDRQLIKWWCRALDPVLRSTEVNESTITSHQDFAKAHVIVCGSDEHETKRFFPSTAHKDPIDRKRWVNYYPAELMAQDVTAPLRCLIPRLPDDPKARFLIDLDTEVDKESGRWRSVKSLSEFWEMMAFRQECAAGRLVGFIWLTFTPLPTTSPTNGLYPDGTKTSASELESDPTLPTPGQSRTEGVESIPGIPTDTLDDFSPMQQATTPPVSPPILRQHQDEKPAPPQKSTLEYQQRFYDIENRMPARWPEDSRGELIITEEHYNTLIEQLLELDFGTRKKADDSSSEWIFKAASLAEVQKWGFDVTGRGADAPKITEELSAIKVNTLTAVKRKRKATGVTDGPGKSQAQRPEVNALSPGLLRKKPKSESG